MAVAVPAHRVLHFGAFALNIATGELRKRDMRVKLSPQAAKVLVLLVTHAGETVTRDQLKEQVWGSGFFVDFEHGLNVRIRQIRAVLDDDHDKPRYIETIPRLGYKFIARVEELDQIPSGLETSAQLPTGLLTGGRSDSPGDHPQWEFQSEVNLASPPRVSSNGNVPAILPDRSAGGRNAFLWLRWTMLAAVTAMVLIAVSLIFLRHRSALVPANKWVQITDFVDSATSPALSPDGRILTFLRGNDTFVTAGQVYVMLLPHGNPVALTNDPSVKMSPVISPDGADIAYTVPWDTWSVPVLGGQPRLWLPNVSGLTWLDTEHVMFSQITSGSHMTVVSSDISRRDVRLVYAPQDSTGMAHRTYLSPDRKWVIVVEMTGNFWDRCRLLPFDGSAQGHEIGPTDGVCTAAAWSPDGKWMYLNSNSGRGFHIWRQRFPNGNIEQITSGPTEEEGIALDPEGKSIVTSVGMRRSSVWLHVGNSNRELTSEATAALADPRNGSPFSPDGKKLLYLVRGNPGREVATRNAVGELREIDLQSGVTQAILPGFSLTDFSRSPDGEDIVFSALNDNGTQNIWVAPLDRSSPPRLLRTGADHPRFAPGFIYYVRRSFDGAYVHRIRPDGSGDEQIWSEKIVQLATSPDGRYLAITVPIEKGGQWKLEIVDWRLNAVQPVCNDAVGYWSDDGRAFVALGGVGPSDKRLPAYIIDLPWPSGMPKLPASGLSDLSQLVKTARAKVAPEGFIGISNAPNTYAYVKETVQRNLYRIPLR